MYASESFPARLRTMGASAMLTADLVANLVIASYFLSALESLGGTATFAMFAGLAVLSLAFVWWAPAQRTGRFTRPETTVESGSSSESSTTRSAS